MRRPLPPLLLLAATLLLAGCPTDRGSRSAIATTTTVTPTTPPGGTGPGGPRGTDPGGAGPGGAPGGSAFTDSAPATVVVGGTRLQSVSVGTGQLIDIPRPSLGNGLQVTGLLERAQGLVAVVRGPLPQDPGAVYLLGDASHQPRILGTGVAVVPGAVDREVWLADVPTADGLTPVRRVDVGQEAPALVQRLPRTRSLAGFGAGGIVVGVLPDADGEAIGPVDVMDPVKGTFVKHLADSGLTIASDGQRAVVLVDGACSQRCTLRVASAAADRSYDLPPGVVPEAGAVTTASVTVFVGRTNGGSRHLWVLSQSDGTARDTGLALPPETGPAPMAIDPQGEWAFARSGAGTLVAVRTGDAEAQALPWTIEPWNAIAVSNGGACACRQAGGGGGPTV